MTSYTTHRLDGLEPDNLLAFMALLGLLRALEKAQPRWRPRVSWTVDDDERPLRPALRVRGTVDKAAVAKAAAKGLNALASRHNFDRADLKFSPEEAAANLRQVADAASRSRDRPAAGGAGSLDRYEAGLWSALVSDAAVTYDGKKAEPTPLCLMFGQGNQHFLLRLASVPRDSTPPERGDGRKKTAVSEVECLAEALFAPWQRPDATKSFRWDPHEDVRYALRPRDPTDAKTKDKTQHGANRLAAVGLSALTVVPTRLARDVRLTMIGGEREDRGGFAIRWPIWRDPVSLAGIRALLGHPRLGGRDGLSALGVVGGLRAPRTSHGRYKSFGRAEENPAL